ncbi:hypothetical protein EDB85DRAFT_2284617 [Lactarius pseudohatsudake]|nr:hypothetical protein EDB85DRAFT_2284617 [Lactarius pseudohatsudake]
MLDNKFNDSIGFSIAGGVKDATRLSTEHNSPMSAIDIDMIDADIPQEFLDACADFRRDMTDVSWPSSAITTFSDFGLIKEDSADDRPLARAECSDSEYEAKTFYYGLPSNPVLVFQTGTPWKKPTGPEAYSVPKEVRPVFDDQIATVWDEMGTQVFEYLDSVEVTWTTIDVVRFAEAEEDPGPVVLWIGVKPGSLSREDAQVAAVGCETILDKFKITGAEVAFRSHSSPGWPALSSSITPTTLTQPPGFVVFSPPHSVCRSLPKPRRTPRAPGAIYLSVGRDSEKVYVLTARHAVFPPNAVPNELYDRMVRKRLPGSWISQPRREVILPGPQAFQSVLKSTMVKIRGDMIMVDLHNRELDTLRERKASVDNDGVEEERMVVEGNLRAVEASIKAINKFHDEVTKYWSEESQRVIGHITYSPAITVGTGTKRYTEDWALIELDRSKIDWDNFRGNVIDLGTEIPIPEFVSKMRPDPANPASFKYPLGGLLPVQGVIAEDELRRPQMHDVDGEPCSMVIKNGSATGTTIGRANGIKSFVRQHFPDGNHETSMEWAILGHGLWSRGFSAPGDSGAIIVDGKGRIGGLLTGGSGRTDSTDVTYATPFYWLLEKRIKTRFPDAHLYQPPA